MEGFAVGIVEGFATAVLSLTLLLLPSMLVPSMLVMRV